MNSTGLSYQEEVSDAIITLHLEGEIDAEAELSSLPVSADKDLVINLDKVTYMNSGGVRNWILWIRDVMTHNPRMKISLDRVPFFFSSLTMMVHDIIPDNTIVLSAAIPFYCAKCDRQETLWHKRNQPAPKAVKCSRCAALMEPDVLPEDLERLLRMM